MNKEQLINSLIKEGYLKSERIIKAFRKISRENFILKEHIDYAYADIALPIIKDQTISQPLTIAFMLEKLDVKKGQKVLEVGAGSGYQAALLSEIVGSKGKVYSIELISELVEFAKNNLKKTKIENVEIIQGDGSKGYEKELPFDRIIVTAVTDKIPKALNEQLKIKGKLIIPIERGFFCGLVLLEKLSKNKFKKQKFHGFVFVPLRKFRHS